MFNTIYFNTSYIGNYNEIYLNENDRLLTCFNMQLHDKKYFYIRNFLAQLVFHDKIWRKIILTKNHTAFLKIATFDFISLNFWLWFGCDVVDCSNFLSPILHQFGVEYGLFCLWGLGVPKMPSRMPDFYVLKFFLWRVSPNTANFSYDVFVIMCLT